MSQQKDFFQVIGHISVFFATWDFFSTMLIAGLVRPEVTLPDLQRATLGNKLKVLAELAADQAIDPKLLEDIQTILPEARRWSGGLRGQRFHC